MSFASKSSEMSQMQAKNKARLERTSNMLNEIQNELNETEEIGGAICSEMEEQRNQLLEAQRMVMETHDFTGKAKAIIRLMKYRAVVIKVVLWLLIVGLAAANLWVVWAGFIHPSKRR
jgi:hypothetical protein